MGEWPVRFAVVLTAGRPVFLAVAFSHLALDEGGLTVVAQEMLRLLAGGAPDETPAWRSYDPDGVDERDATREEARIAVTVIDSGPNGAIRLTGDTAYVPRRSIAEMLYGMERLLVAGANRDIPAGQLSGVTGVRAAERGPGWVRCRDGYADLAATRAVWREVVGTDLAEVHTEAAGAGHDRMIAYAVDDRSVVDLHRRLVSTLGERTDVRAPDWYVRCAEAPRPPADRTSWAMSRVVEEGTGRLIARAAADARSR